MLNFFIFKFSYFRFIQNGLYVDYFLKKIIEIFIRNIFIYTMQFFAEKYIIEYFTKKIIDSYLFNLNKFFNISNYFFSIYFIQILTFFFLFFSFLNIFFLFI